MERWARAKYQPVLPLGRDGQKVTACKEHIELSKEAAKEGMVLLKNEKGSKTFNGKTDYLTEFTRVAEEIRQGKTESDFIPFEATRECMMIMEECRKQMKLVYPFEIK